MLYSMKKTFSFFRAALALGGLSLSLNAGAQPLYDSLYRHYDRYREEALRGRRFKHADLMRVLERHEGGVLSRRKIGGSVEGRDIFLVSAGTPGKIPVLLWSQMHGDEPTATGALADLFNFLEADDGFNPLREKILSGLRMDFLPMLNPDGAQRFVRENALGIDLNRDARALQSPESRLLKRVRDSLRPVFGFNLHDQSGYHTASRPDAPAAFAFLAPPYDNTRAVNGVRRRAMQVAAPMNRILQRYVPGLVSRYSDAFEPRGFGDNLTAWGTSVLLVESGATLGDPEKQEIRRLNFVVLLAALASIADGSYAAETTAGYDSLPRNGTGGDPVDLLLRNVRLEKNGTAYKADMAFRVAEVNNADATDYFLRSRLTGLGDLKERTAYRELDAEGYETVPARVAQTPVEKATELTGDRVRELLAEGVGYVRVSEPFDPCAVRGLPLRLLEPGAPVPAPFGPENDPVFFLKKDGVLRFLVAGGRLWEVKGEER